MDNSEIDSLNNKIRLDKNQFDRESIQNSQEEIDDSSRGDEEPREKLTRLPLGRIKTIIKMDPEVSLINQEATFLVTKSVVNKW